MASPIKDEETGDRKWVSVMFVGQDYAEPLGLDPIQGRTFETARPADVNRAVVLTEKAVDTYGLTRNPVGQTIAWGNQQRTVVGVVENFHNESLREPIRPVVLAFNPENTWTALVQLKPGASRDGLDAVRRTWNAFLPDRPFAYSFLDQQIEAQYRTEQRLTTLFGLFAGLAIVVAGLGLFGLAAYSAQQRWPPEGPRRHGGTDRCPALEGICAAGGTGRAH